MKTNNLSAVYKHMTQEQTEEQKIQLATHKMELGLAEDVDELARRAQGDINDVMKIMQDMRSELKMVQGYGSKLVKLEGRLQDRLDQMANVMTKLQQSARDLGVDENKISSYVTARNVTMPTIMQVQEMAMAGADVARQIIKLRGKL